MLKRSLPSPSLIKTLPFKGFDVFIKIPRFVFYFRCTGLLFRKMDIVSSFVQIIFIQIHFIQIDFIQIDLNKIS